MEAKRAGESGVFRQRRPRFFNQGRDWYFRTREGASIGPFSRLSEAVAWAQDYTAYTQVAPDWDQLFAKAQRSVA